jgi:hypothetical protein
VRRSIENCPDADGVIFSVQDSHRKVTMSKSSWLDRLGKAAEQRAKPAEQKAKSIAEPRPQRASPEVPAKFAPKPKQKPVVQMTWFQTRPASEGGDLGAVEAVYYFVSDGVVTVCDELGERVFGAHGLAPDEDAKRAAVRIAKQLWLEGREGPSHFHRPLRLRRPGIA